MNNKETNMFCFCCMATDALLNIFNIYLFNDVEEDYCLMLHECYDIQLTADDKYQEICCNCVEKLREAYYFKIQITNTLKALNNLTDIPLKEEPLNLFDVQKKILIKKEEEFKEEKIETEGSNFYIELQPLNLQHEVDKKKVVTMAPKKEKENLKKEPQSLNLQNEIVKKKAVTMAPKKEKENLNKEHQQPLNIKNEIDKKKVGVLSNEKPYVLRVDQTQCDICNKEFQYQKLLVEHMHVHYPNYICEICGSKFVNTRTLTRHKKIHMTGPFICKICQKEFKSFNTYSTHLYYSHNDKDPYICRFCKQRFKTFCSRLNHMKSEHNIEPKYSCPHCEKKFYYSGEKSSHVRKVHVNRCNYTCSQCGKEFPRRNTMVQHLAHKHGIGTPTWYDCDKCQARLKTKWAIQNHMKKHDDVRRFKCGICDTKFVYKCLLKNHMATHERNNIPVKIEGDTCVLDISDSVSSFIQFQEFTT